MTKKEQEIIKAHAQQIYNNYKKSNNKEYQKECLLELNSIKGLYMLLTHNFLIINE